MKVSTSWQSRHASMVPLFAESQAMDTSGTTAHSLISMTQGSDIGDQGPGMVQATQDNFFPATVNMSKLLSIYL